MIDRDGREELDSAPQTGLEAFLRRVEPELESLEDWTVIYRMAAVVSAGAALSLDRRERFRLAWAAGRIDQRGGSGVNLDWLEESERQCSVSREIINMRLRTRGRLSGRWCALDRRVRRVERSVRSFAKALKQFRAVVRSSDQL